MTDTELQAVKRDIETLRADLQNVVRALEGEAAGKIDSTRSKVSEAVERLKQKTQEGLQCASRRAKELGGQAVDKSRECITERPLTYVIGSFVAGILVGKLLLNHKR